MSVHGSGLGRFGRAVRVAGVEVVGVEIGRE
jgi:hypothetical protein